MPRKMLPVTIITASFILLALVHDGRVYHSRIVEVEAIGCDAQ